VIAVTAEAAQRAHKPSSSDFGFVHFAFGSTHRDKERQMRKFTLTLAVAALVLGSLSLSAAAQTQAPGAATLGTQAQNATIIREAACRHPGRWCAAGMHRRCGPYRCWCAPCW
jgi:hypothetical protein